MASTEHLRADHNLRSEQKREAVLRAARAIVRSGMQVEWVRSPLARACLRSSSTTQSTPNIKARVKEMIAAASGRDAERQTAEDLATIASLRVELLNLRAALGRKDTAVGLLERKLSRYAGRSSSLSFPSSPARCSRTPSVPTSARLSWKAASVSSRRWWTSETARSWRCATRCATRSATGTPARERVPCHGPRRRVARACGRVRARDRAALRSAPHGAARPVPGRVRVRVRARRALPGRGRSPLPKPVLRARWLLIEGTQGKLLGTCPAAADEHRRRLGVPLELRRWRPVLWRGAHRPDPRPARRARHRGARRQAPARARAGVRAGAQGCLARMQHALADRRQAWDGEPLQPIVRSRSGGLTRDEPCACVRRAPPEFQLCVIERRWAFQR